MLSNIQLKKDLGKRIGIYPFIEKNIEGSSIYLTASKFAWSLSEKKSMVDGKKITIRAKDTTFIFTEESISIDKKTSGICLSRVSHATMGLYSASTPIKPGWTGRLIISLYNATDKDITIKLGDAIVVVQLFRLKKEASFPDAKGGGGRIDLLTSFDITLSPSEIDEFNQRDYVNSDDLIQRMKSEESYKKYMESKKTNYWLVLTITVVIVMLIEIIVLVVSFNKTNQINGFVALLFAPTLAFLSMLISKKID